MMDCEKIVMGVFLALRWENKEVCFSRFNFNNYLA